MARLDNRVALLTGGAKGIGRHYAQALAREGARLMFVDVADIYAFVQTLPGAGSPKDIAILNN